MLTTSPSVGSKAPVQSNRRGRLLACLPGVLLTAAAPAAAETLHLKDGTVLVGSRQREADGKVYFKSDLLGDLVIDAGAITAPGDAAVPPGAGNAPAPAGPNAGAADKTVWSAKVSAGGTYTSATFKQGEVVPGSGVTGASLNLPGRQLGAQLSAVISRAAPMYTLSFEGKFQFLDIQPLGRQAESYVGALSLLYHLNDTYYAASRTSLFRDTVKHIDYSFMQLLGVGRLLIDEPATKLELIPGVVLLVEGKNVSTDGDPKFGAGALEHFSHASTRSCCSNSACSPAPRSPAATSPASRATLASRACCRPAWASRPVSPSPTTAASPRSPCPMRRCRSSPTRPPRSWRCSGWSTAADASGATAMRIQTLSALITGAASGIGRCSCQAAIPGGDGYVCALDENPAPSPLSPSSGATRRRLWDHPPGSSRVLWCVCGAHRWPLPRQQRAKIPIAQLRCSAAQFNLGLLKRSLDAAPAPS